MDPEARRKRWEAKISLKAAPERPGFFTSTDPLSASSAYARVEGDLPASVTGPGRDRAVLAPVEPGDTFHLEFHGVGEAGETALARLWGLEPRGHGYDGRHIGDFLVRLGGDEIPNGGYCRRAPCRNATSIDILAETAPFPGVMAYWNGHFCNMTDLVMGVWDYTAYILEVTLAVPEGQRPMRACAAFWRAYTHPKPLTDAQIKRHHEEFMEQLRDGTLDFKLPDEDDPEKQDDHTEE